MNRACRSWLLLTLLATAGSAFGQSTPQVQQLAESLYTLLEGAFDNEPQHYLAAALGSPDLGTQTRRHLTIARQDTAEDTATWFDVVNYPAGSRESAGESVRWRFAAAEDLAGLRMWRYQRTGDGWQVDNRYERCRFLWRKLADGALGEWENGRCRDKETWSESRWIVDSGGLAIRERQFAADGELKAGRSDGLAERLSRTTRFECFVAMEREGQPPYVQNPVLMHDGGDVWTFDPADREPAGYALTLRKAMWPSRSGRNFLPLLFLDLSDTASGKSIGAGWAEPSSDRIGFNFSGGSARCKQAQK